MSPTSLRIRRVPAAALALCLTGGALFAAVMLTALDPGYADQVISVVPGFNSAGLPEHLLGPPTGGGLYQGSPDTYSLGLGGSITVQLDPPVVNGAGTDLIVCENPFLVLGTQDAYVETMYVEVSTNGVDFARFPSHYAGPAVQVPEYTGVPPTRYKGLAGVMPVSANPPGVDPLDVVAAGGDAFDLDALLGDPLVISGVVDLWFIQYLRLVDVRSGVDTDSGGTPIWDCGSTQTASADVDAIIGVNTLLNQVGGRPQVEVDLVNDVLVIRLTDIDGVGNIKNGLTFSVNGFELPFGVLLPLLVVSDLGPTFVEFRTPGQIPPGIFAAVIKVAARDKGGLVGGDATVIL